MNNIPYVRRTHRKVTSTHVRFRFGFLSIEFLLFRLDIMRIDFSFLFKRECPFSFSAAIIEGNVFSESVFGALKWKINHSKLCNFVAEWWSRSIYKIGSLLNSLPLSKKKRVMSNSNWHTGGIQTKSIGINENMFGYLHHWEKIHTFFKRE